MAVSYGLPAAAAIHGATTLLSGKQLLDPNIDAGEQGNSFRVLVLRDDGVRIAAVEGVERHELLPHDQEGRAPHSVDA